MTPVIVIPVLLLPVADPVDYDSPTYDTLMIKSNILSVSTCNPLHHNESDVVLWPLQFSFEAMRHIGSTTLSIQNTTFTI